MGETKYDFTDQVVVITGTAQGIGKGMADAFAKGGARVYLLDIQTEKNEAAAKGIRDAGGRAVSLQCNVSKSGEVNATLSRILSETNGRLDVLVNTAGGFYAQKDTADTPEEEWDEMMERNLKSVFLLSKAAIPTFQRQKSGRIINFGSMAGVTSLQRSSPAYSAAKAGIHALTRVMARELGPDGVTVNAIAPGTTATERVVAVRNEEERKRIGALSPLGRMAEVPDMVGVALFLASPEAGFITGQTLQVNGGRLMI